MRVRPLALLTAVVFSLALGDCVVQPTEPNCAGSPSCGDCTSRSGCGWCGSSNQCVAGDSLGATAPSGTVTCDIGSWYWSSCAMPVSCTPPTVLCSSSCVDVTSDPDNCGSCGQSCSSPFSCCSGQCLDTQYDSNNCGGCGLACTTSVVCVSGTCGF